MGAGRSSLGRGAHGFSGACGVVGEGGVVIDDSKSVALFTPVDRALGSTSTISRLD